MNKVLSQSEIESLLMEITAQSTGTDNAVAVDAPVRTTKAGAKVQPLKSTAGRIVTSIGKRTRGQSKSSSFTYEIYDFRRPDKLSKDQLRTLQMIHETFARLFSSSISGYLRSQVQVDLISVEQIAYEEYIKSVSSSLVNVLSVAPLTGQMIYEIDLSVMFVMLDRLLGGTGDGAGKAIKGLTDIEKVLANNIVKVGLGDLAIAWENVMKVQYETVSVDTSAQFVQIVPNNDTVVLVLMEIRIGEHQGAMSFCVPFLLLKPILAKLNAQHWFTSKVKKPKVALGSRLAERLRDTARVPCVARLGISRLNVETISTLKVGQMIPLTVPRALRSDDPPADGDSMIGRAEILIGNQVKFRGRIGIKGRRRLAVQVEEVLAAQPELISHKELS